MKIQDRYKLNKESKVRTDLVCPSCGSKFIKNNYQQAFCKTKNGTQCKDKYWNTVTPTKYNNTTRISPASRAWSSQQEMRREEMDYRYYEDMEHPFSSEALGQD